MHPHMNEPLSHYYMRSDEPIESTFYPYDPQQRFFGGFAGGLAGGLLGGLLAPPFYGGYGGYGPYGGFGGYPGGFPPYGGYGGWYGPGGFGRPRPRPW